MMNTLLRVVMVPGLWLPILVAVSSVAVSASSVVLAGSLAAAFSPLVSGSALPAFSDALEKRWGLSWPKLISCRGVVKTKHDGISEELLAKFKLYAEYAAAAYCACNNNSPGTRVTCPTGNCELVKAANATTISEFENTIKSDDTGFIAIDDVHKVIVLSFRGSRSKKNWFINFNFAMDPTDLCTGCNVHKGYWSAWKEARPVVIPKIQEAVDKYPDYGLVVTGHSLGAAVATLAAAHIRKLDSHLANITELASALPPPTYLSITPHANSFTYQYTFGSPRIGDETTAVFLTSQSSKSFRITASNDPVPRIPGVILGYKHMSPEYWMKKNIDNPSTEDFVVLTGTYNTDGNSGKHWLHTHAHGRYFGQITKCRASKEGRKRGGFGGLDAAGDGVLGLLTPYVDGEMPVVDGGQSGRARVGSITFPAGALEAVYGPDADRDTSTTVFFGIGGQDVDLGEGASSLRGDARNPTDQRAVE